MARGRITSPHHPAICPQDPVTRHKGVFCTLDSFQQQVSSRHVNTKVFGAPELSLKKLLHFTKHTLLLPSQGHVGGKKSQKAKSQSTSSVNKIQFLSQRFQDCRQFKTRTGGLHAGKKRNSRPLKAWSTTKQSARLFISVWKADPLLTVCVICSNKRFGSCQC